ncbi:hypothetical protein C8J57DRAFT_1282272 [Mycena rebaudengoi]|nr:hypothetical protein C8J57DRAFT_1282272 [Mycena rebaudengoi]
MSVDVDPSIRFIDLNEHPKLRVQKLVDHPPQVLVRQEYIEFMTHVMQTKEAVQRRFFLTGQPGIGKQSSFYASAWVHATSSYGCSQSGQSVFFIPATNAQVTDGYAVRNDLTVRAAVARSWQSLALVWYMSPWSSTEIAAVTCALSLTPLF